MANRDGIKVHTQACTGTASAAYAAVEDPGRPYLGLYAQSGTCLVSFGTTTNHATEAISIAEGNLYEPSIAHSNNVIFSGNGNTLLVITDFAGRHLLFSDAIPLTYDSEPIYYTGTRLTNYTAA